MQSHGLAAFAAESEPLDEERKYGKGDPETEHHHEEADVQD